LGDVEVGQVGDTFHLFHLVLPNHNFIAYVSNVQLELFDKPRFVGYEEVA
jgi:hypothetical protein